MKNSEKIIPILSFIWLLTLGLLGFWWMYIIGKLGQQINNLHSFISGHGAPVNLTRMIYWEGGFFLLLTVVLTITLMVLFWRDHKKNKAIHSFFASVGHEIKTPLASIKLQAEMIESLSEDNEQKYSKYLSQIQDSTLDLEAQIDNLLQLSRIELNAKSHLTEVDLKLFLEQLLKDTDIKLETKSKSTDANIDELALKVIFKNLLENGQRHAPGSQTRLVIHEAQKHLVCSYTNFSQFGGDPNKLGTLFYKHNSPNGSGIGIYLIKELMKKMGGELKVTIKPHLEFHLYFSLIKEGNDDG